VVEGVKYFIVSSIKSLKEGAEAIGNFAVEATLATADFLKSGALAAKNFFIEAPQRIKDAFCFIFNCDTFRRLGNWIVSTAIATVNGAKHLLIKAGNSIQDFVIKSADIIKDATVSAAIASANFIEFVVEGTVYILFKSAQSIGNFVVEAS